MSGFCGLSNGVSDTWKSVCPINSIGMPNSAQSRPITQSLDWVIGIGGSRLGLGLGFFGFFGIGRIGLPPKMCPSNLPQIGGDAHVKAVSGASTYALLTSLLWMWSQNHCKASERPYRVAFLISTIAFTVMGRLLQNQLKQSFRVTWITVISRTIL